MITTCGNGLPFLPEDLTKEEGWVVRETRRRFDPEFQAGAVRIVRETGKPIAQVAKGLGINAGTLAN
ncbi:transposase (plasmid) [Streptosporangium sp. NBC_01495]|uniref:transposase n=1 Tax=Streptosporangium sp. NBC_01495 TaxID=2903899 RepID=UPI002E34962F|nr:transposase [Streptosporangium sp. NBC_01495]